MRDLFDGSSVLPSSRERNVAKSILAKPLDPDRMIAIIIGHEEAYDVYDQASLGRAKVLAPAARTLTSLEIGGTRMPTSS
jgi:hypothetical protein